MTKAQTAAALLAELAAIDDVQAIHHELPDSLRAIADYLLEQEKVLQAIKAELGLCDKPTIH